MAATADSGFMMGDPDRQATQVPFSDDDSGASAANDNGDDDDKPTDSPEERKLRRDRRQERLNSRLKQAEDAVKRTKELEERDTQRERELAEMRGQLTAMQRMQQQPANDAKSEYEKRLDAVYAKQSSAYTAAQAEVKAGTFTEARAKHYEAIAREVETEKTRIHTEWALAQREPAQQQERARGVWVAKYPEVYGNSQAYKYAEAMFHARQALGETQSAELVEQVMEEAMVKFKLGAKKAPSASDRSRMSGLPSSGSGGGSRDAGVTMTPELRRIATAAHPDLSEADAIKRWVNSTGKRMREKKML